MHRWAGRVAVVTGASSAIGAAITQQLVTNAVNVVGMARRVEKVQFHLYRFLLRFSFKLQDLASILKSEPGKLYPIKCDITKDQELKDTFSWVKDTLGGVDLLINNAGTNRPHSLTDGPDEVFKRIVDVNILALARCTRLAIQSMRERGVDDGHILHINSIAGHFIHPGVLMYSASKHAVTVMTEGLRRELWKEKSRIRVTVSDKHSGSRLDSTEEFMKTLARPVLCYGSEAWTLRKKDESRITANEMKFMRYTAGYTKWDHKRNEDVMEELRLEPVINHVKHYQNNWVNHLHRMHRDRIPKVMLHYRPNGKRSLGRSKKRWIENSTVKS
ncbi:hypothetical protein ANN_07293 [Periplaneta americana]|uniref:Dehydrogenase/reductase SDR family member 11 n=1 Tax=Periplaneta americana TaxID=6978 RepID=A0ABQ8TIH3_PERAM|nr:hypothetical protein ANN_07293 [Periplaneta americana]